MSRVVEAFGAQRVAVAILVVVVLGVLGITVVPAWSAYVSRQATLDGLVERLHRYEQLARRDQALLPRYQALRRSQMAGGNYLKSGTEAVAGAELQRRITEIAAANEAQIVSTRILPATNETGFVRIAIKVRMQGSLPAILASLYDIESDEVFMFLDNTSVRDRMAGRAAARQGYRLMEADLDVIAYMPDVS